MHDGDVQAAIDWGAILRTHALRPTWHYLAAEDIGWIQALTGPRVLTSARTISGRPGSMTQHSSQIDRRSLAALRGGNHLTRKELGEVLGAGGVEASGIRAGVHRHVGRAEGLIANGAMRGKQHTYALVEERTPDAVELHPEEALAELTRRYFTSHGPATIKDFVWWSSPDRRPDPRGAEPGRHGLRRRPWRVGRTGSLRAIRRPRSRPRCTCCSPTTSTAWRIRRADRWRNIAGLDLQLPNNNTIGYLYTIDSQLAGSWRRIVARDGITAELSPVVKLTVAKRKAVEAAFRRYAEFANVPVRLKWLAATPIG